MDDPEEHARAVKVRGKALGLIRRICAKTSFGLLCPANKEAELDAAVDAARQLADDFNGSASYTTVAINLLKGRVAETDTEAVRAIVGEIGELIQRMENGVETADVAAIREAANRARATVSMLSDEQQEQVNDAIAGARKAAREIVKRVEKAGEDAAFVVARLDKSAISKARMAFLDMGKDAATETVAAPSVQRQRFADLDFEEVFEPFDFTPAEEV
jgi:vacuolar-type H+-ATPase subunit H